MLGYWIGFVMALSVPAQVEGALCDGQPNGTECWQKLSSHSDCYFWTDLYVRGPSFEWTGDCVDGLAQGRGRLEWSSPPREDGFPDPHVARADCSRMARSAATGSRASSTGCTGVRTTAHTWRV